MPHSTSDPRAGIRFARVLTVLAESDDCQPLSTIAASAGLPASTVHRILDQLVESGLAKQGLNRQYGVGLEFSRIGTLAAEKLDVVNVARPVMQRIVADCHETCLFGLYMEISGQMTVAAKVDSKYPLKYRPRTNVHRTLVWGATGLAILAWLPGSEIEAILDAAPRSPADASRAIDREAVMRKLQLIREQGYALTKSERTSGAVGIAVPILGAGYRMVGDLCLTIPEFRYDTQSEARYVRLLKDGALQISRALGKQPSSF